MKKNFRDLLPLVAICLLAAMLLAVFNLITKGPIEENAARAAAETRTRLLASASTFEQVELEEGSAMDSCYEGFDAEGNSVGYVVETTVGGYGGEIVVTVGMDSENVITGINVGGENFSETAGLGAQALTNWKFLIQFLNSSETFEIGSNVDALTGATVTSKAVARSVNSAIAYVTGADTSSGATSWGG